MAKLKYRTLKSKRKNKDTGLYNFTGKVTRKYSLKFVIGLVVFAFLLLILGIVGIILGLPEELRSKLLDSGQSLGGIGTVLASIHLYWNEIKKKYALVKLQNESDHIVICGLGEKGKRLIDEYVEKRKEKVVVIESNKDHSDVPGCWEMGIPVVSGDAAEEGGLKIANTGRAKLLFALTGNDNTNIEIAHHAALIAKQLYDQGERTNELRCYCHVTSASAREIFSHHELFEKAHDWFDASMFSAYDSAARFVFEKYPPDFYVLQQNVTDRVIRILLVGFDTMGEALVKQAARVGHYLDWDSVEITIVGKDITPASQRFMAMFGDNTTSPGFIVPRINLKFIDRDPESLATLSDMGYSSPHCPGIVLISINDDSTAVSLATRLHGMNGFNNAPIVICMRTEIADLMSNNNFAFTASRDINVFNIFDFASSYPILVEEVSDKIAIQIHTAYLLETAKFNAEDFKQTPDGPQQIINSIPSVSLTAVASDDMLDVLNSLLRDPSLFVSLRDLLPVEKPDKLVSIFGRADKLGSISEKPLSEAQLGELMLINVSLLAAAFPEICPDKAAQKPALRTWRELTEDHKESNRWQADHLSVKLRAIGYPVNGLEALDRVENDELLLERLSELEHRRWAAALLVDGWRYGERDDIKKTHNCLKDYNQLSNTEKFKDKAMITNIRKIVMHKDWDLYQSHFQKNKNR